jgi:hypothetical protein
MKKFILSVLFVLSLVFTVQAQSGYSTGRHYSYKGTTTRVYSPCYVNFVGYWVRDYQYRQWYQEQYSGYVYRWNGNSWVYQWKSGFYWYYRWSPIYTTGC